MIDSDTMEPGEGRALLPPGALGVGALLSLGLLFASRADRLRFGARQWLSGTLAFVAALCLMVSVCRALRASACLRAFEQAARLAFLSTTALGLLTGPHALDPACPEGCSSFILNIAGAFVGALLVTWRSTGLVEVNHPPSEATRRAILEKHVAVLDSLPRSSRVKRAFDVSLALIGLFLSLPLWVLAGVAIWLEDPGPIIFAKVCVARGGGIFRQYKFRSMIKRAEEDTGPVLAREDDPRVTRVGKLIRKSGMDELPQLLNILHGTMSFVGPRPQRAVLVAPQLRDTPEYAKRHAVQPGLTGVAQVYGDYYVAPRERLCYDMAYVERFPDFWLDLRLFVLSLLISFSGGWQNKGERYPWMLAK